MDKTSIILAGPMRPGKRLRRHLELLRVPREAPIAKMLDETIAIDSLANLLAEAEDKVGGDKRDIAAFVLARMKEHQR